MTFRRGKLPVDLIPPPPHFLSRSADRRKSVSAKAACFVSGTQIQAAPALQGCAAVFDLAGALLRLERRAGHRQARDVHSLHRTAFRMFWRWKSRRRGRPALPKNIKTLIQQMARENPTWGEERIANELSLK